MKSQQVTSSSNGAPGGPPGSLSLLAVARGQRMCVLSVRGDDDLARRLDDQGLCPGVIVELMTTAPGGDPMLFRVQGYRLALRRDEAERVLVEPAESTE